jgi:hypothetical protein
MADSERAGVYVADGDHDWPLVARSPTELTEKLEVGGK